MIHVYAPTNDADDKGRKTSARSYRRRCHQNNMKGEGDGNGERLYEFASIIPIVIRDTLFPHKDTQ